jgi:cytosine/adenosine deaminase-related metal-dependent hydrolase
MVDQITVLTDLTILTIDPLRRMILTGHLIITNTRITAISPGPPPQSLTPTARIISLPGRILIPGLINTHAHTSQSLLRGLAEDLSLHPWLCDKIWPLEASYTESDGYVAARLTIAEMLLSGTTTFLEAMLTPRAGFGNVARAVGEMGIRACLGKLVKATGPGEVLGDARDKDLDEMGTESLREAYRVHHRTYSDRIHVWAALGTPRGAPLSSFAEVGKLCREDDMGITMHCAEAPADPDIIAKAYEGRTPGQFCEDAGLLGLKTVLAHMVHVPVDTDGSILARSGATVAHNPTSNLKLASGVAPIPELLKAGVNVSLGTDGAPCNNTYDMLREMHLASILHKGVNLDAKAVGAREVLEMATINGARALGLEKEVGSLEVGKKADLVVLDVRGVWAAPWDVDEVEGGGMDPVSLVVGCCTGRDVEMVFVDGKMLVEGGRLVGVDEKEIGEAARRAVRGIRERSGVGRTEEDEDGTWVVE